MLGVVAHTYSPSTQEAEAGESQNWDQPKLSNEILSQQNHKLKG